MLPRVPNALGEGKKHSGKNFRGCLSRERGLPSAKNRTLREAFPECRVNTRGELTPFATSALFFKKKTLFLECNTRRRNLFFKKKILFPECNTRGRKLFFRKPLPWVPLPSTRGRMDPFFLKKLSRVPLRRHSRKPPFFGFSLWISTNQQQYITKHIYKSQTNKYVWNPQYITKNTHPKVHTIPSSQVNVNCPKIQKKL
jgi:hypothetical protein